MAPRSGLVTPALLLLCVVGVLATQRAVPTSLRSDPKPPTWPDSYSVEYVFSLPYTKKIQPDGIRYPVSFHRDAKAKRTRMGTYNDTVDREVELTPQIDQLTCLIWGGSSGLEDGRALPDLTGWGYDGETELNGQTVHVWRYAARHQAKVVEYLFYATPEGAPVKLHMHGTDALSGSHFDEWVFDYGSYTPGRPDAELFASPDLCAGVKPLHSGSSGPRRGSGLRMAGLLPRVSYRGGHTGYDAFLAGPHGASRRHASMAEYTARAAVFQRNADMIDAHNARNASYTMAMNRFGDWHREEFHAAMLRPSRGLGARRGLLGVDRLVSDASSTGTQVQSEETPAAMRHGRRPGELAYEPLADKSRLPASVDWRGTGADAVAVKDQASCGSCWSFGGAGAMEAAWFMATGEQVSLSEQQIMDCSWGIVPGEIGDAAACDGGEAWAAVAYAVQAGGLASTAQYQYKGQPGYCMANTTRPAAKFRGWAAVPHFDDAALMEAVYSRGPLAVSMDASQDSFTFYSSGVYAEPACMYKKADLDHSMVLMGYGTGPEGDYWIVRNSWSDHWGDAGYFKVARDNHGCGAPADATYVVADP